MGYTGRKIDVRVDSLGGLGDGLATYEGKSVFIPKSCAGDSLRVRIVHENRNGLQGTIEAVLEGGPQRREAPCGYYAQCGGCTLQHLSPDAYKAFKTKLLSEALNRAGYDVHADIHFLPHETRRRVEFKLDMEGKRPALAFHALRSHSPVAVSDCLLLTPALQALIAPLNELLAGAVFTPHLCAVALTQADSGIDMILELKQPQPGMAKLLYPIAEALDISRISLRMGEDAAKPVVTRREVEMQLGGYAAALPPGAFLQATAEGQALLTRSAMEAIKGAKQVVDLFCGIGSYSFPASREAQVHAVELDAEMVQAVKQSTARHKLAHLSAQVRDLFKHPLKPDELSRFDAAIINPPRLGAKAQTEAIAQSGIRNVAMISCNPATFARDAAILKNHGFTLERAQGVDQFVYSTHLEIAAVFRR